MPPTQVPASNGYTSRRRRSGAENPAALACVIGDISMVRALGRSGIPVALIDGQPNSQAARSRYCVETVSTPNWVDDPDGAVDALLEWARDKATPPVIFYQGDHDLLALSRCRDRLGDAVRVVLPPADLVEALVDKLGFAALAERAGLPVPRTRVVDRHDAMPPADWVDFPCVLKPSTRGHWFDSELVTETEQTGQKAIRAADRHELAQMAPLIRGHHAEFVMQAEVVGGEENIVSYHAYVRPSGEIAAEFTGRKIRTAPMRYGISTCVEITDDPRTAILGRDVLERLGFTGVVKIDFKEDARDGELYLLELNPRFNLWHHPATVAGVSIPAVVYADCTAPDKPSGRPVDRTQRTPARAGVRWVAPRDDLRSIREAAPGFVDRVRWLGQVLTSDVNEGFSLRDPWPGVVDLAQTVRRKVRGIGSSSSNSQPLVEAR